MTNSVLSFHEYNSYFKKQNWKWLPQAVIITNQVFQTEHKTDVNGNLKFTIIFPRSVDVKVGVTANWRATITYSSATTDQQVNILGHRELEKLPRHRGEAAFHGELDESGEEGVSEQNDDLLTEQIWMRGNFNSFILWTSQWV